MTSAPHQLTDVELKVALVGVGMGRDMLIETLHDTPPNHPLAASGIRLKGLMDDFMAKFEALVDTNTEVGE